MLQFILGRASTGKTYAITEKTAESVASGLEPVLLVPEQFSFESEKCILDRLGDNGAQKVSVISFTRLCDEVERQRGGICGITLSEADKIIMMNKAIRRSKDRLQRWGRYSSSAGFSKLMVDTIGEFKINAISAEDLIYAATATDDAQLKLKLMDTACIYTEYDMAVSEKFIDPSDRLTKLYNTLEDYKYFENKTVFLDSFKGFTGQQYKIIARILSQAKDVYISLTDNPQDNRRYGLFSNIKHTKQRIESIAAAHGVDVAEDIILAESRYVAQDMRALEELMCQGSTEYEGDTPNITLCKADNIYYEAEFAARNIRKIVREKGAHYSDFVIIARDTAPYEDALENACKKHKISCFIDRRLPLSSLPPAVAMLSAVELTKGLSTEKILRFHKSGIGLLEFDEITELENYTYLWNIDGKLWQKPWDMNPNGFSANDENASGSDEVLARLNSLRNRAISPIIKFKNNFNGTASDMASAIVELFEDCNAPQQFVKISNEYKQNGDNSFSDGMRQSWDKLMGILNSLTLCFGDAQITQKEFCEALNMSVGLETVGIIPQMIDEVTFGSADRIRPSRPRFAFILGANQGVFPRITQSDGLFSSLDREKLAALINLPNKTLDAAIDEEFLLYSNLCCASERVFVSCSANIDGAVAEPSAFMEQISKKLGCNILHEPSSLSHDNLPETAQGAFSSLCTSFSGNGEDTATLKEALKTQTDIDSRVDAVFTSVNRPQFSISREAAHRLFGDNIRMSPSKFDTFNRCRFMYFCRYGLNAQRLQPAEFSAMQRGTLVHFVLEKAVERHGKNLSQLNTKQIYELVDQLIGEYLDSIPGYRSVETPRLKFLVSTISRTLKYVVSRLALEFAQSDFEPKKCELKIGYDGDIEEIKIPIEQYGKLSLTGIIDRLDTWNGYVRIVDYKTGHRDFKLPDILFGQNMQMLIYLYAVSKSEQFGGVPAGILYMSASRAKDTTAAKRRMNGLIPNDMDLVCAMEKENKGEFVPRLSADKPSDSFVRQDDFDKIFDFIERRLKASGKAIFEGQVAANPVDGLDSPACSYCDYASICRIEKEKVFSVPKLSNREVIDEIERQAEQNGI